MAHAGVEHALNAKRPISRNSTETDLAASCSASVIASCPRPPHRPTSPPGSSAEAVRSSRVYVAPPPRGRLSGCTRLRGSPSRRRVWSASFGLICFAALRRWLSSASQPAESAQVARSASTCVACVSCILFGGASCASAWPPTRTPGSRTALATTRRSTQVAATRSLHTPTANRGERRRRPIAQTDDPHNA